MPHIEAQTSLCPPSFKKENLCRKDSFIQTNPVLQECYSVDFMYLLWKVVLKKAGHCQALLFRCFRIRQKKGRSPLLSSVEFCAWRTYRPQFLSTDLYTDIRIIFS
jgi:hypothetical protein